MYPDVRVDGACEGTKSLTRLLGDRQALQVPTGDRWGLSLRLRGRAWRRACPARVVGQASWRLL